MPNEEEEIIHKHKEFNGISYEDKHLLNRVFVKCTFTKCSLKGCFFEDSSFEDCVFDDCDLSLMKFKSTSLFKVTLKNCKAIGVIWTAASNPFTVSFQHTRISYGSFAGKNLKKQQFINCFADDADFSMCDLSQSDFSGTDLQGAVFYNTDLSKANFTGATNYAIDPRSNKIAKAKFSMPEAMCFIYALGIEIVEPE